MVRLQWLLGAAILGLAGYEMLIREVLGWTGWLLIGIGIGVGASVLGSLAHDLLAHSQWP